MDTLEKTVYRIVRHIIERKNISQNTHTQNVKRICLHFVCLLRNTVFSSTLGTPHPSRILFLLQPYLSYAHARLFVVYYGQIHSTASQQVVTHMNDHASSEARAKRSGKGTIIGQYIRFCHVFDVQVDLHGSTRKAVEETIRICQKENVLKDYLEQRKQEVVTIMMTLFSQEEAMSAYMSAYGEDCRQEGREEGREEGRKEGRQEGREEGRESTALNMLRDRMSIANIAKYTHLPEERILELAKML